MDPHLEEIDKDRRSHLRGGDPERMAEMFGEYHAREAKERRWRWLKAIWNHTIFGVPTILWFILAAAAFASLNLSFGRPWF